MPGTRSFPTKSAFIHGWQQFGLSQKFMQKLLYVAFLTDQPKKRYWFENYHMSIHQICFDDQLKVTFTNLMKRFMHVKLISVPDDSIVSLLSINSDDRSINNYRALYRRWSVRVWEYIFFYHFPTYPVMLSTSQSLCSTSKLHTATKFSFIIGDI